MKIEKCIIREIEENDFYKNYMNLINYFTKNSEYISFDKFNEQIKNIKNQNSHIIVIEYDNKIIGTAKIFIEYKLHNNFKNIGHIEDFVIDEKFRKNGLGYLLIDKLIEIAKNNNCYKIVLNCNDDVINFYKKNNFSIKGTEMCFYL